MLAFLTKISLQLLPGKYYCCTRTQYQSEILEYKYQSTIYKRNI